MSAAAGAVFVLRAGICARLQQRRCLRACGAPGAPSVWFPFAGQKSPELGGQGRKFCTPGRRWGEHRCYFEARKEILFGPPMGGHLWTYPHAMDVRESLNAALLVWGLASRLFIRVIKNPTHTKSFSSTGRERAFLRGFRKTRSFQHLLMGVLACLLKNTSSQHGGFVAFCNVSKKMRYELDSQIPGIPGSEYPGRPKWTIRSWKARQLRKFYLDRRWEVIYGLIHVAASGRGAARAAFCRSRGPPPGCGHMDKSIDHLPGSYH